MSDTLRTFLFPLEALLQPQERLYWNYLLMAYVLGGVIVWIRQKESKGFKGTIEYLFPKGIWQQWSVFHDVGFSYLTLLLQYSIMATITAVLGEQTAQLFYQVESSLTKGVLHIEIGSGAVTLITTLALATALDFALYLAHWLLHRVPFLWPFHSVHHSAETLTPFTGYRQHPIDTLLNTIISGIVVGLVLGLLRLTFGTEIHFIGVGGQTIVFLCFYLFGYHLRHTHIWLDYGPRISQVFISPAQHQIHHSIDFKHQDKNFGYMLAVWDRLFGTLYIPQERESLRFGIHRSFLGEKPSFVGLLYKPFVEVIRHHQASLIFLGLIMVLLVPRLESTSKEELRSTSSAVELDELTSPEVSLKIRNGYTTIIVPTGGTEQNGPHMALGKHNAIIRANASEVAITLGHTLVAPVMAYVPEGEVASKEGHMAYPGTLSIRSSTFQSILSDTARSLKAHGFRRIIFMGDSGGNQKDQEDVARDLSANWKADGVEVISLSDYYSNNHQADYLAILGYSPESIGHHGGMRDTSELLYIHPEGVRKELLADRSRHSSLDPEGSDGNTLLASQALGKSLTLLKIEAAVRALKAPAWLLNSHNEGQSMQAVNVSPDRRHQNYSEDSE